MARYTGPKSRIARKFGEGIFGADKVLSKKNYLLIRKLLNNNCVIWQKQLQQKKPRNVK